MTATTQTECNAAAAETVLYMSLELGQAKWGVTVSAGMGAVPRYREVAGGEIGAVVEVITGELRRLGLAPTTRVRSCYEAGRDGCWVHRALTARGIENVVVDSASIEVNRRARRTKTDKVDGRKLVVLLQRWAGGERDVWRIVRVPPEAVEEARGTVREIRTLKKERTRLMNRVHAALALEGVRLGRRDAARFGPWLWEVRRWDGHALPAAVREHLERVWAQRAAVRTQIRDLERGQRRQLRDARPLGVVLPVQRLLPIVGIGATGAWTLGLELGWRDGLSARTTSGLTGLTPTPYRSGTVQHEQGIGKAGLPALRALAVELAVLWLRYQPQSELTQWYTRRFGTGAPGRRKLGIVALARKLIVALVRVMQTGEYPSDWVVKAV